MNKNVKKVMVTILAIALCICLIPIGNAYAESSPDENKTYD